MVENRNQWYRAGLWFRDASIYIILVAGQFTLFFLFVHPTAGEILAALLEGFLAFALAYEVVEKSNMDYQEDGARFHAYLVCFLMTFFLAVAFAAIASAPVMPGDEDSAGNVAWEYKPGKSAEEQNELAQNTLFATILPALLGVRSALGKRESPQDIAASGILFLNANITIIKIGREERPLEYIKLGEVETQYGRFAVYDGQGRLYFRSKRNDWYVKEFEVSRMVESSDLIRKV